MAICKYFQQGNCRYGHGCRFDHIYGSKYSYRAPQVESAKSSKDVFNTNTSRQASSASSLFRSAVQNTTQHFDSSSSHMFAQNHPTRPSVFDRLGPQPSNAFSNQNNQANQAKSIFAQANQSMFEQTHSTPNVFRSQNQSPNVFQTQIQSPNVFQIQNQTPNVFQTQNQPNAKSLFAQATQSIFGQSQPTNSTFVNEQNRLSNNTSTHNRDVFQISNKPTSNVFGVNGFEASQFNDDDDIYSKIEELSKSDIEAFESEDFKLGFIPELPPPRSLCVM
ncbi:zinc finger CCCH domain-containing protein 16-like [Maniola jurtina]|uniref:zinc finger CCCH domain-containing protein 16-like n=1 Tax=Maniola jurtina TaxID=191418 RepID=UPI001E6861B9|nr:zinc finger CCCH domain-containing protein 16-like [Maniola jurtina]